MREQSKHNSTHFQAKNTLIKALMLLFIFIAGSSMTNAAKRISGTIMDGDLNEPLVGATIAYWNNGKYVNGVSSGIDGKFTLTVNSNSGELRFTMIGYTPQTMSISDIKKELTIVMSTSAIMKEEVVVTGYFNKNKNSFTGAVQQISGTEIKRISGTSAIQAIAALTPGMQVVKNSAMGSNPNNVPELVLRGMTSFSNTGQSVNQPTIILDGVEISMQDLYDLDMNEIESINVLKDASASALYGSKAANGVIVINRKSVKEGSARVSYSFTGDVQIPDFSDYNLLNAEQKLEYEKMAGLYTAEPGAINSTTGEYEQYELDRLYNSRYQAIRSGVNSNWLVQPARTSFSHDHSLRIYGGASNIRYELTGRFADTKGVMKDDYRHRYNLGFNLSYNLQNKFTFSNRTTYSEVRAKDSPYGNFSDYTIMNPYDKMYNDDGTVNTHLSWDMNNPLYEASLGSYSKNYTTTLTNTTNARWDINKEFRLTGMFTLTSSSGGSDDFTSPKSLYYKNETDATKKGCLIQYHNEGINYSGNIVGAYNHTFNDNSLISVTIGGEINHSEDKSEMVQTIGYFSDNLSFIGNAVGYPSDSKPSGSQSISSELGAFANATYSFRDRYMIDGVYRTTGSSRFGANNRWGHFWSAGCGWNIHNEKFLKGNPIINRAKLRANMGYTGKVSFSAFQAMTMYKYLNTYEYLHGIGALPLTIGNEDLRWERTMTYNAGADLSFWKNRINVALDFYLKRTTDLLLDQSKAPSTGVTSAKQNIGEIENKGFEFQADAYIIQHKDLYWQLGASGYANRNKILKINSALEEMNKENEGNEYSSLTPLAQYAAGESTTAIKVVRSGGIDPATGKEVYIKLNGERTFEYDPADKYNAGDTEPKFSGAFFSNLFWKGISLYVYFDYRLGGYIYNSTRASKVEGTDPYYNADIRVFESRWKNPGDVALYRDIASTDRPQKTDRFVEKENTLELSTINIGYEFPEKICKKMKMKNLRVGINFKDLLRFSTVKIERGTSYLYSKGFELSLNTTF